MKKYVYIIFVVFVSSILLLGCSNESVSKYEGEEQFFSFGSKVSNVLRLSENNTSVATGFGFMYPADKDYTFNVKVTENTLGDLISINGSKDDILSITIAKGEKMADLVLTADMPNINDGAQGVVKLELDDVSLGMTTFISDITFNITKPCKIDADHLKDWEGYYTDLEQDNYTMEVKYIGDNTFSITNFIGVVDAGTLNPQPVKVVFDYSVTDQYSLLVEPGYFYSSANTIGLKVNIMSEAPNNAKLYGAYDPCTYTMGIAFYLEIVNGTTIRYERDERFIRKAADFPQ